MEKKLQKLCLADNNLLTAQDLRQPHSKMLSIVLQKELRKIKYKICNTCCLEYANAKDALIEFKCLFCNNNCLTMISISLFCCGKKLFIHMNSWMIGKSLMRHHYQKKKRLF